MSANAPRFNLLPDLNPQHASAFLRREFNDSPYWHHAQWRLVCGLAEDFGRLPAFEPETGLPGFSDAFTNYRASFWDWVMEETPDALLARLNRDDNEPGINPDDVLEGKCQFLQCRAVHMAGLRYEPAHQGAFYRLFRPEFDLADELDDHQFTDAIAEAKDKRRLKKRDRWGHTQFNALRGWIAGGLWCLPSFDERAEALTRLLKCPPEGGITGSGLKTACQRLGLSCA